VAAPPVKHGARSKRHAEVESDIRRLMARELHDRVAQTLTTMLVDVENFKSQQVGWDDVLREMDSIQSSTRQVLNSLRQLLHDLRGENPVGDSFVNAVGELLGRFGVKTQIVAELEVRPGWPEVLTPAASLNLYRIIEEALSNVRMHSGAHSVRIVLEAQPDGELTVAVNDDGRGVDTTPSRPLGFGTVGMKERALFLGGHIRIVSESGAGTSVRAVFPKEHLVPVQLEPELMIAGA
jgi:signal transduction histidine kinase